MIEQSVQYIQSIIVEYGAFGVFLATMIEEIIAPIPSALVPLASGFFLLPPDASFALVAVEALVLVAIPVAIGISLASAILYAVAYYGGKPVIERYKRIIGISWRDVERIEQKMTKGRRDEVMLFVLRIIPVIPGFALSGFCGIVRYPFTRFMVITFVASALRAFALALAGWQAGEFYMRYLDLIEEFEKQILSVMLVGILLLGFWYYVWSRKRLKD